MPGARKSKYSKEGRASRRRRYGDRNVGTRRTRPIVLVVCDDTNTAPAYFMELKRQVRQHVTLHVVEAPCQGATADAVVLRAIEEKNALTEGGDAHDKNVVWTLIDLEGEPIRRRQAQEARDKAKHAGVRVALSDPCYELWTLLHFEDTGILFKDCGEVLARVKLLWKLEFGQELGPKAQADYWKIIDRRQEAARRAETRWNHPNPSRTEVFKVVQDIDACVPQHDKFDGHSTNRRPCVST